MPRKKPVKHWQINVSEEVKLTVALSLKKLSLTDEQKELVFPSSLNSEERKYIHAMSRHLGYKSKSRNKGSLRFITVYKKEGSTIMGKEAVLDLTDGSKSVLSSLLQRWPVTNKERQDLLPTTEKDHLMNTDLRDFNLFRSLTRGAPGPPQIPVHAAHSEISSEAKKLPVWSMRDQILSAANHNQVIMVAGETGSGKTTQVPQLILQESCSSSTPCRIFCTQPRRISAISMAERVASERGEKVGYTVGYQIRLEGKVSPKTILTFCTTGILLRTLMAGESALSTITHIIVDEVHERSRFSDFLLIVLRDCLPKFRNLKLILMSANLDVNLYAKYFNNCPVINVPGKNYPVKEYFLEDVLKMTSYKTKKMEQMLFELGKKEQKAEEWTAKIKESLSSHKTDKDRGLKVATSSSDLLAAITDVQNEKVYEKSEEMDMSIEKAFTTGEEEHFSQMLYLIFSENFSPDYQHSSTLATPLMVATGRGRLDVMEQLLALGASVNLRAANDWTAANWAHSTGQQEALKLLESYSVCEGVHLQRSNLIASSNAVENETKDLLKAYSMSIGEGGADVDLIFVLIQKLHNDMPPGGILVFLPGYEDIVSLRDLIVEKENDFQSGGNFNIFCLHSSMQSTDQKRVFQHLSNARKIVLSTNIAETSVTINDIVYVIDSGKVKEISFDAISGISALCPVWISQASAVQRKGRAGRCQPGICYHLFSRNSFTLLQPYQTPEILRTPLQDLCLHTKLLAMPNILIADFIAKAPEAPAFIAVKNAVQLLKSMDALDPWEDVTELGHHLLDLPLSPNLGKMVLVAAILKCLDPILTIAASLSHKEPFVLPRYSSEKRKAKACRKILASGTYSDHFVLLRAFQSWQKACSDQDQMDWCAKNYISPASMEIIHGIRSQVLAQLRSSGFVRLKGPGDIRDVNTNSENWAVIKAVLISGMYPNLIRVDREQNQLRTERESKVRIHNSSIFMDYGEDKTKANSSISQVHKALVQSLPSDWLIYDEMIRVGMNAHVKTVSLVSPLQVLLMAGPMRLPLNALSEPSTKTSDDASSNSESEERPEGVNCFTTLDTWVQFLSDHQTSSLALQLRHKLNSLILRRFRAPNKPFNQGDDDIVRTIATVLSKEDQKMGLLQPVGVGQRPRPFFSNSHIHDFTVTQSEDNKQQQKSNSISLTHSNTISSTVSSNNSKVSAQLKVPNASKAVTVPSVITPNKAVATNSSQASNITVTTSNNFASSENTSKSHFNNKNKNFTSSNPMKMRYYIIRVSSYKQIEISQNFGVWAFTFATEKKIVPVSQNNSVILVFALNRSNQFYGYAKFLGKKYEEKGVDVSVFGSSSGVLYKIEWIRMWYIHFHQARHLQNPFNDNLQIHMCRDGQEVEPSIGEQLINLWNNNSSSNTSSSGNSAFSASNDQQASSSQRHAAHNRPHGPHHPHLPPFHHGAPPPAHPHGPFQRPFRGYNYNWDTFGGNYRVSYRGGYNRR